MSFFDVFLSPWLQGIGQTEAEKQREQAASLIKFALLATAATVIAAAVVYKK